MTNKQSRQALIVHAVNGKVFHQRKSDGYINGTEFCKANGRIIGEFLRLPSIQDYIRFLTKGKSLSLPPVFTKEGKGGGTWLHPKLAIQLGQWISVEMMDLVSEVMLGWMSGTLQPREKPPHQSCSDWKEARIESIPVTVALNNEINRTLNQEKDRVYQHVEDTMHAIVTGMSARYHKEKTFNLNGVDLLIKPELQIYSNAKTAMIQELKTYPDSSLARGDIRGIAKKIAEKFLKVTQIFEEANVLDRTRYIEILPDAKKKNLLLLQHKQ